MFFVRPSGDVYRWRRGGCDMKGGRVSADVSESEVTPKAFPQSSGSDSPHPPIGQNIFRDEIAEETQRYKTTGSSAKSTREFVTSRN